MEHYGNMVSTITDIVGFIASTATPGNTTNCAYRKSYSFSLY
jgi:hypothetical protein